MRQPAVSTLPGRLSRLLQMWWLWCGQMGVSSSVDTCAPTDMLYLLSIIVTGHACEQGNRGGSVLCSCIVSGIASRLMACLDVSA